jgi:hypothetical protein
MGGWGPRLLVMRLMSATLRRSPRRHRGRPSWVTRAGADSAASVQPDEHRVCVRSPRSARLNCLGNERPSDGSLPSPPTLIESYANRRVNKPVAGFLT